MYTINHICVCYFDNSPSLVNGTEIEKMKIINIQLYYIDASKLKQTFHTLPE